MDAVLKSLSTQLIDNNQLVRQFSIDLLGKKCYKSLLRDIDWTDSVCLRIALSKLLGTAIVMGGGLVKLPQILKILASGSTQGLSVSSYLLETIAYSITLAYNVRNQNPFSTFGEVAFVTLQNAIILVLMHSYKQQHLRLVLLVVALVGFNWALYVPHLFDTGTHLAYLQAATIPVSILSKIPQIFSNYREKSTGQLSAITVLLFFFGSLARVFTTYQEVKDPVLLWGFSLATVLNGILAFQIVQYWNSTAAKGDKKKKLAPLKKKV